MKNTKSQNIMMIALGAVLFLGTAGGSYWQWSEMNKAALKVKDLRAQVKSESDVNAELVKLQSDVQTSQQKLDHLEQGVPARAYVPTMMRELESIGRKNGIEVTGVRPMPPKFPAAPSKDGKSSAARKPYDEQLIEVKGNGHYMNVLQFLASLETFPKIVAVSQVTLLPKDQNRGEKKDASRLEVTVELRSFLFSNPEDESGQKVAMGERNGQG